MEENERTIDGEVSENIEFEDFSEELVDLPHVTKYIHKLEEHIRLQQKNILQLKEESVNNEKQPEPPTKKFIDQESQTQLKINEASVQQEWFIDQDKKSSTITDQVTEAAESAMLQTGFVYEKTTGLYYHYNSGYYYDSKSGLYYDGNTGTYYYYDKENETYKFHSQIHRGSNESVSSSPSRKKRDIHKESNESVSSSPSRRKKEKSSRQNKEEKHRASSHASKKIKLEEVTKIRDALELEEGECESSSDDNCSLRDDDNCSSPSSSVMLSSNSDSEVEQDKDSAKVYPPCMRIVVKETNLVNLKVGNLFIVTYTGGSIGREGDHSVIVPDINVSKHHAKLQYNESKKLYEIIDLGSRNGTLLNGKRLSVAKQESEPVEIVHGSILQLGSTKLLCHVHSGHDTCGHCEPGLLGQSDKTRTAEEEEDMIQSKKKRHRRELKRLKSKFGLEQQGEINADGGCYQDRAQTRRDHIGSSCDHAKTQQSSLNESIPKDNLGFKMLSKMGWNEGKSLGKNSVGLTEPIPLQSNPNKAGLGSSDDYACNVEVNSNAEKKQAIWKKTQQRFNECAE